jgi:hypothetical protein
MSHRFLAVAVVLVSTAAATLTGGAQAQPVSPNIGPDPVVTRVVNCFTHHNGMGENCVDSTVSLRVEAGVSAGLDVAQPMAPSAIVRLQIDRFGYASQQGFIAGQGPIAHGDRGPLSAGLVKEIPDSGNCALRYHVHYVLSARMANNTVIRVPYSGPWFDSGAPHCAGLEMLTSRQVTHCFIHQADGAVSACFRQSTQLVKSADRSRVFARGAIAVSYDGGVSQIARVQVDHVDLLVPGRVVARSPAANSGNLLPENQPPTESQTLSGFAWSRFCSITYQAVMYYSVRYTNGSVYHGSWPTATVRRC